MTESTLDPAAAPLASSLVDRARARLAAELAELPPSGSPLLAARLRVADGAQSISLGALTHFLRDAIQRQDLLAARDLFTALLWRIEGANVRWAVRTVGRTPRLFGETGHAVREDLLQELALALWRQLGRENGEAFELFFFRALDYQLARREDPWLEPWGGNAARRQALPTPGHQTTRCAIRTPYRRACGKVRVWRWLRATTGPCTTLLAR